jgi:hypothetical protein
MAQKINLTILAFITHMIKATKLSMITLGIATIIAAIATGQQQIAFAEEPDLGSVEAHLGELDLVENLEAHLDEFGVDEDLRDFIIGEIEE